MQPVIDPALLEVLACPRCENRPPLRLNQSTLICDQCGAVYPIINGVPHLLPESADRADSEELQS